MWPDEGRGVLPALHMGALSVTATLASLLRVRVDTSMEPLVWMMVLPALARRPPPVAFRPLGQHVYIYEYIYIYIYR